MKIKEVTQTADAALYEAINKKNKTGVKTSNLVKVMNARNANQWTEFDSVNDVMAWLEGNG